MVLEKAEQDQGKETNSAPVLISCPIAGCFLDFLLLLFAGKDDLEGDTVDRKEDVVEMKFSSESKRMAAAQKHFRQLECIRYG
ncbi:hypothetical protein Syun_022593 [Stephania yunnanensis]|uniref:Uncharacterized protein n=1 Tax=Stephania yunnanensis TaxID=152371 RepID=A0AAP0F9Y6_9MAGN